MAVFYALVDNPLTQITTDLRASVRPVEAVTEDELIEMIVLHNTGITDSVARKVLAEYQRALRFFLEKGRHVNTPLLNTTFSISGVFDHDEDTFDRSRHELKLNFKPGLYFKGLTDQLNPVKVEANANLPLITGFVDTESGTQNDILTPNELVRITGKRLKFDETDPEQGVFLVNAQRKDVRLSKLAECMPSKIIGKAPDRLAAGAYKLEVRTGEGRVGQLKHALTVK